MKKALQTTIAGILFTIEEDAYEELKNYLDSIKTYFGNLPDSDDVVVDIEARIAEQLSEIIKTSNNIVSIDATTKVMDSMGSVEEITGSSESSNGASNNDEQSQTQYSIGKKLFRDSDDRVIAGVASGMALYFGLDTLLMRIIFIVLTLITSGGFIFVYLVLALLVPRAITAADKLNMRGGPVTLSSFKESIEEQVKKVKDNGSELVSKDSSIRKALNKFLSFFGRAVRLTAKVILKAIGLLLVVVPTIIFLGIVFALVSLVFNSDVLLVNTPVFDVISHSLYYFFLLIGFIAIVIPVFFVASIGIAIVSKKHIMNGIAAISLAAIWLLALIVGSTVAIRHAPDIEQKINQLPELQIESVTISTEPFTGLILKDRIDANIIIGDKYEVTIEGAKQLIDNTKVEISDNNLVLVRNKQNKRCFFCFENFGDLKLTITVPESELSSITISDLVKLSAGKITADSLKLNVSDISRIEMSVDVNDLEINVNDLSRAVISGTAENMELNLEDASRFDGETLMTTNAKVVSRDASRAHVEASQKLEIVATDGSRVTYKGTDAIITQKDGSRVENVE